MTSTRTLLSGYQQLELLHSSSRTLVYRGLHLADNNTVIVKLLNCEYPTFSEILNFRNQYTIAKNLDFPGIVKPLTLEHYGNGLLLVMEDFGGISLSEYIAKQPLGLEEFFPVAIALTQILEQLYRHRVIHKDIKPSNILIHPESKQIKLIDFSISSLLPRETQVLQNPNVLEGTLAYISPEQTGRMNRGIDYRSDFYSLGVTFYQLLTGQLPFVSEDPMELVHSHIAKIPTPPHPIKNDIPHAISDIVMKLMAKTAEQRYQSALGLKSDLQKCLFQWQETNKIQRFELGERDLCDRFLIPEKLYGRETEVQTLLEAFNRVAKGTRELMLVAGFSGIGKTAVINEVHKPIVRQRGYFIKGKFDQFQRNIPFSAFVQAFRDLMRQLLSEGDTQLETWKSKILTALGENGQVIIDVIPELEQIIGQQPPVPQLSGSAAQNRFNRLFQQFIQVFTTADHPLVMFIDDLQWADSASLKLMQLLMSDSQMGYLLLLGAYRDNEVFPAHPLMLAIDEIAKSQATLNTITLVPLSQGDLNRLVADTLSCQLELALPLTKLIHQKTKGNPFFATQFLKGLHEDGWIAFNFDLGHWQCDMTGVRELALTDDVVEFIAARLHKLSETTQEILKLAACIGNQFDLNTLAVVSEQSQIDVATYLWVALQEGLVLPLGETYKFFQGTNPKQKEKTAIENISVSYKFLHDRVQQAAYLLIPQEQKQAVHLNIGQLLWQKTPQEQFEDKLFDIVNQLNIGAALIPEADRRQELAQLNLRAGQKVKISTAYEAAIAYFNKGLALLPANGWQTHYTLTRDLTIGLAEAEYLKVNLDRAEELIAIVLKEVKTLLEQIPAYKLQIGLELTRYRFDLGLDTGLQVLERLGFSLDKHSLGFPQLPEITTIESLPIAKDDRYLAAMEIAAYIYAAAVVGNPKIYPPLVTMAVTLAGEFGQSPASAYAYANYGMLQSGCGNLDVGYRAGLLAVGILDRFGDKILKCKVYAVFNAFIRIWNEPLEKTLEPLSEAIQSGLETGDYEYAGYCATHRFESLVCLGTPLDSLLAMSNQYIELATRIENPHTVFALRTWRQVVLNLLGLAADPCRLIGQDYDETIELEQQKARGLSIVLFFVYIAKLMVLYFFGAYTEAVACGEEAIAHQDSSHVKLYESLFVFYYALALLANCPQAETERQDYLDRVAEQQKRLQLWACSFPPSFQHKWDLVAAEKARVEGDYLQAIELYERAITAAQEHKFLQDEALANELAAKFYLEWGKPKIATAYMQDAYYCYSRWGAKGKVEDLEKCYPHLLTPIIERQKITLNPSSSLSTLAEGTVSKTTTGTVEILDLTTLMKASRTLSQTIELEGAIANLMQVAKENAGAETIALMLWEGQELMLTAKLRGEEATQLNDLPVETSNAVPLSIVNKVKRSQQPLLLENASQDPTLAVDPYIHNHQPLSILCLPLLDRGQLRGLLYLENNQVAGAFTGDRLDLLNLLCSQAAISLENARLYRDSQNYARRLEHTQMQLVHSEKMATVGQLTAGIAHEINNPVSFISGNLKHAQTYTQDLISLLELYQESYPNPTAKIAEKIEAIELDYLLEDLPQIVDSMKEGTQRITQISQSMRTFSRSDTVAKVPFNIHDGLESTLLILKHRLKANENRPAIDVIKEYGDLPRIPCYPGQLNQVFMNLLANAIDALEECNAQLTFAESKARQNRIAIVTEFAADNHQVRVRIGDNGKGIPEEIQAKIFDNLFTTKPVGKGTGIGLALSRNIIEQKHSGRLTCISQMGNGTEFAIALPIFSG